MTSALQTALLWLNRHQRAGWILLFAYAALVTFPHEEVQTLVGLIANRIGRANLYRVAAALAVGLAALLTIAFLKRLRANESGRWIGTYWAATLLLIAGTWAVLTANNTELVHYPQYFVPGVILAALTLSPVESLAWITLAAGLDECFQYWGLHGGWGVPFDFNDVLMDFLGGALGVLFAMAFLRCRRTEPGEVTPLLRRNFSRPGLALYTAVILSGAILFASGKMLLHEDKQNHSYWFALSRLSPQPFWFFDETWGPRTFHTLSPLEGPILLIVAFAFYAVLNAKLHIQLPDEAA